MTNQELIEMAASIVKSKQTKDGVCGDVGSAVFSKNGKVYLGVCAGLSTSVICAERFALMSMITDGEYGFEKIVAVWKDENGTLFVIPPCGNCREFMREIDAENLQAEVVLDREKAVALKELLPYHDWWQKQQ